VYTVAFRRLRIAEPFVAVIRQNSDAVGFELVEGISDLSQALVDIWQRQHGEDAEPAGIIHRQLPGVLVGLARDAGRRFFGERPHLWDIARQDRGRHTARLHIVERLLYRPVHDQRIFDANQLHGLQLARRREVMVHVDTSWHALREAFCCKAARGGKRGSTTSQHFPAADGGHGKRPAAAPTHGG
jgi:hypothetical protein